MIRNGQDPVTGPDYALDISEKLHCKVLERLQEIKRDITNPTLYSNLI